jgi:hypothetical protein
MWELNCKVDQSFQFINTRSKVTGISRGLSIGLGSMGPSTHTVFVFSQHFQVLGLTQKKTHSKRHAQRSKSRRLRIFLSALHQGLCDGNKKNAATVEK